MDSDEENPRTSKFQSEREDLPPPPLPDPSRRAKPGKAQRQQRRQERTALDLQALGVVSSLDTADPRFHVLAAKALREPQIHLVKNVVEAIGAEATLGLLGRTKDIQEAGGVRVQEGGALKAAGGVFFSLFNKPLITQRANTTRNYIHWSKKWSLLRSKRSYFNAIRTRRNLRSWIKDAWKGRSSGSSSWLQPV